MKSPKRRIGTATSMIAFLFPLHVVAGVLNVPSPYPAIQSAINASSNGDTVLVQPGTYYENILFRGRRIVVTGTYWETNDRLLIEQTVINGGTPASPDTGSCVLIIDGEDSTAVLQGFTLTGGTGTLWQDEHSPGVYREGGGILIALSSPTVQDNIITGNTTNLSGGVSTGGGGIRLGDGSPRILNNVIMSNSGMYGGGVVSNFATPVLRNNVIARNIVSAAVAGPTYGGGGVWVNGSGFVARVENNTIVFNSSSGGGSGVAGKGGGVSAVFGAQITGGNNIVWGNTQLSGAQAYGGVSMSYCDVEDGLAGTGNITSNPAFADSNFYLRGVSPCVDAGNPDTSFTDPEDPAHPGQALLPSKGTTTNDMGAYGGHGSRQLVSSPEAPVFVRITSGAPVTDGGASRSVNWIDYDNDGILDLFVTNGLSSGQNNCLYRGDGPPDYTFTKIAGSPIVTDHAKSDGSSWADIDNDGDLDAFVVNWYGNNNLMYTNNGDGTFTQVATGIPVTDGGYSETCSWGDYDNDGFVDLFVSNSAGTLKNYLYHNDGNGTFTKITAGAIVNDVEQTRGVTWVDYDGDGDQDMFVVNEGFANNSLYKNMLVETSSPDFVKITGVPIVSDGLSSWSASWGDYDNDGDRDVVVANQSGQDNMLFSNNGDGTFTQVVSGIVVNDGGYSACTGWGDIDNDGDLDLFITSAYAPAAAANSLYRNMLMESGSPGFIKITGVPVATDAGSSYGFAFDDYDADGDLDLFIAKTLSESENNALYRNESDNNNHWLEVNCTGTISNRSAIGAVVRVLATIGGNPVWQMADISGQSGYCGQHLQAHFGLGDASAAELLIVEWPSGARDAFAAVQADRIVCVAELDMNPPSLISPPDQALNQPPALTLSWSGALCSPLFHVQVATDSLFASIVFEDSSLTEPSVYVTSLVFDSVHWWRVSMRKLETTTPWSAVRSFLVNAQTYDVPYDARWSILSFPLVAEDTRVTTLFHDALTGAYRYSYGLYTEGDSVTHGTGFWMKFPSAGSSEMSGFPLVTDTVSVTPGWNIIGSVTQPLAVSSISSEPPSIIASKVYSYRAGYSAVDSLVPFKGYWVKVSKSGELILNPGPPAAGRQRSVTLRR